MQKCEKCSNKFKKNIIIKTVWFKRYNVPMLCNKCNSQYYVNFGTKLIAVLSTVIPIAIASYIAYIDKINKTYFIFFYIIWIIVMMMLTPFYAKFHIKSND